jgi:hypothetical protein
MYRNTIKKNYVNDDDYGSPEEVFTYIDRFIPKDKVICDPFYLDGSIKKYTDKLGWNFIHEDRDFWTLESEDLGDIVFSNPPFGDKQKIIKRLIELNKPFILLLPVATIHAQYFISIAKENQFKLCVPPKRINFIKNGEVKKGCAFDCIYICYNIPTIVNQLNFL